MFGTEPGTVPGGGRWHRVGSHGAAPTDRPSPPPLGDPKGCETAEFAVPLSLPSRMLYCAALDRLPVGHADRGPKHQ